MVVPKLVTYMLLHSRWAPSEAMTLSFKTDDRRLHIDVGDHHGSFAQDARRRAARGLAVANGAVPAVAG